MKQPKQYHWKLTPERRALLIQIKREVEARRGEPTTTAKAVDFVLSDWLSQQAVATSAR